MRKILLGVLVALLLALSVYTAVYGISLGNIKISGIPLIKQKNAELETKIEKANQLKNETYPSSVNKIESEYKNLISEKERYEQVHQIHQHKIIAMIVQLQQIVIQIHKRKG